MELHRNTNGLVWKRRTVILLAAFFVLYAVLDISVLQAYCGNETLGIPPYAAQLRLESERSKSVSGEDAFAGVSHSSDEEPSNETPSSDDACFCCCSHTTLAVNLLAPVTKRPANRVASTSNFPNKDLHSDSHPSPHYQPPKLS